MDKFLVVNCFQSGELLLSLFSPGNTFGFEGPVDLFGL